MIKDVLFSAAFSTNTNLLCVSSPLFYVFHIVAIHVSNELTWSVSPYQFFTVLWAGDCPLPLFLCPDFSVAVLLNTVDGQTL